MLSRLCFIKESQRNPDQFRVCDAVAAAGVFPAWDGDLAAQLIADFELPPKGAIKKLSRGITSAIGVVLGLASRAPVTLCDEPYLIEKISDLLEHVLLIDHGRVLRDADAVTLRATALSVTGPARQVATFAAHQLLQTESMADRSRATVETTSIQQLVVAMRRATTPPAATAPKQPSDLQGVSR